VNSLFTVRLPLMESWLALMPASTSRDSGEFPWIEDFM
jgi:hypothetical protein